MARLKLFLPLIIFAALAVLFWRGLSLNPQEMPSALLNKPVPEFSLPKVSDGETLAQKSDLPAKPLLMNVWATWCIACRVEHPYLNGLAEQGVPIVGVNLKDDDAEARQWLEKFHNPYLFSVADRDGRLALDLGVFGAPETFLVDAEGMIRCKHVGVVDDRIWQTKLQPLYERLQNQTWDEFAGELSDSLLSRCQ
ncbi:DsbE family thiol:disulfide interchange protein [Microbulbifer flavimaris]|uniref:DsbE family thiol:disulfide interchange protein n=1 Tax=Microbulbifer flavimaris TaxID=1781068 RepID=A0ABX4HWN7_9GAMM|nr:MULTISPECIES: DsbE family thiol:disulfide interchange protein [Microbulbifer]KUJ79218.1 thiol:disulfide interchange protein [Microbulbifer sp. ZGT114]PCO04142.1 DsbE family thiol:disulfide interchange protein [Microbulbifer flavimaris]